MPKNYECEGEGAANSDCQPTAGGLGEVAALDRADSTQWQRDVPAQTTDEISHAWTTVANEPGSADWVLADYAARNINVTNADTDISYRFRLLRVASGCGIQETLGTSGSLTGTGQRTFSLVAFNPAAGAATDRYQLRTLGSNAHSHMGVAFTITPNEPATHTFIEWEFNPVVDDARQIISSTGASVLFALTTLASKGLWALFSALPGTSCQKCHSRREAVYRFLLGPLMQLRWMAIRPYLPA